MTAARKEMMLRPAPQRQDTHPEPGFDAMKYSRCTSLPEQARSRLERSFGTDLSHVRVHDDAVAHDTARRYGAKAFATGNAVAFSAGRFRPESAAGDALLAHEVAHVVQQRGGAQASGGPPVLDPAGQRLEREAEAAAAAHRAGAPMPALGRVATGTVQMTEEGADPAPSSAVGSNNLPAGITELERKGDKYLRVRLENFTMPYEKGMGPWVAEAYQQARKGKRLIVSPILKAKSDDVPALEASDGEKIDISTFKEGKQDYKTIWLRKFGFGNVKELSTAFEETAATDPKVGAAMQDAATKQVILGMQKGLGKGEGRANCDIDHIVEKQMGGTSIPSNLQLLDSDKNQESGRMTFEYLVTIIKDIRSMRGNSIKKMQIEIANVTLKTATEDGSWRVESLLRQGLVRGNKPIPLGRKGAAVGLSAGGVTEVVNIADEGRTSIALRAKRLVPGARLNTYVRGGEQDEVIGSLDKLAKDRSGVESPKITLIAEKGEKPEYFDTQNAIDKINVKEFRDLSLNPEANKDVAFYYPYLSPGTLRSFETTANGGLKAAGEIRPTISLIDTFDVIYEADETSEALRLKGTIKHDQLNMGALPVRFTSGELAMELLPELEPSATLSFEIAPAGKALIKGEVGVTFENDELKFAGRAEPAQPVPGLDGLSGEVTYSASAGWAGTLTAASSSLFPGAKTDVSLRLRSNGDEMKIDASGGITAEVMGGKMTATASWGGEQIDFAVAGTIPKPFPIVEEVALSGSFVDGTLTAEGKTALALKVLKPELKLIYTKEDGKEGKFSGGVNVRFDQGKASGNLNVLIDKDGDLTGSGALRYAFTDTFVPALGAALEKDGRIKLSAGFEISDMPLIDPKIAGKEGAFLLEQFSAKTPIPLPPPVTPFANATLGFRASVSLGYHINPPTLVSATLNGSLYPFEDNKELSITATGSIAMESGVDLESKFALTLGLEVLYGVLGIEGGAELSPSIGLSVTPTIAFNATYAETGFRFDAEAYATAELYGQVGLSIIATVYALKGLISHDWEHEIAKSDKFPIPPQLKVTFGRVGYDSSKADPITWPSTSQFKISPEFDPKNLVQTMVDKYTGKQERVPERPMTDAEKRRQGVAAASRTASGSPNLRG